MSYACICHLLLHIFLVFALFSVSVCVLCFLLRAASYDGLMPPLAACHCNSWCVLSDVMYFVNKLSLSLSLSLCHLLRQTSIRCTSHSRTKIHVAACRAAEAAIDRYLLPAPDFSSKPAGTGRRRCCRSAVQTRGVRKQIFRTTSLPFQWLHSHPIPIPIWNLNPIPIFSHLAIPESLPFPPGNSNETSCYAQKVGCNKF